MPVANLTYDLKERIFPGKPLETKGDYSIVGSNRVLYHKDRGEICGGVVYSHLSGNLMSVMLGDGMIIQYVSGLPMQIIHPRVSGNCVIIDDVLFAESGKFTGLGIVNGLRCCPIDKGVVSVGTIVASETEKAIEWRLRCDGKVYVNGEEAFAIKGKTYKKISRVGRTLIALFDDGSLFSVGFYRGFVAHCHRYICNDVEELVGDVFIVFGRAYQIDPADEVSPLRITEIPY